MYYVLHGLNVRRMGGLTYIRNEKFTLKEVKIPNAN